MNTGYRYPQWSPKWIFGKVSTGCRYPQWIPKLIFCDIFPTNIQISVPHWTHHHTALTAGRPPSPRSLSSPPDHCFSLGPPAYCLTAGRPLNPRSLTSPPDISLSLGPPSYCFHSRPTNQSKVTLQPSSSQFLTGPQLAHTVTMTRRIFTHPVYTQWPHFLPYISCCALARASYSQVITKARPY